MVAIAALPISREEILKAAESLPTGPRVLAQLEELLTDPSADLDAVAEVLRPDTGITTRVLRISNSPIFSRGSPASSIEEAIARLGLGEVRRLAAVAAMAAISEGSLRWYGVSGVALRENSLLTALIAEQLAGPAQIDSRSAYTAGLLRSTGKIVLERAATRLKRGLETVDRGENSLLDWERQSFGSTNTAACADVLKSWRFPADIFIPIRDHYLSSLSVEPLMMAVLLNLAASSAEKAGHSILGETAYWLEPENAYGKLGMAIGDVEAGVRVALEKFARMRAFLQ